VHRGVVVAAEHRDEDPNRTAISVAVEDLQNRMAIEHSVPRPDHLS
jgi:hypothetical protein